MSLFKNLGASAPTEEELDVDTQTAIQDLMLSSWAAMPVSWQATATQAQVEDYLLGVAEQAVQAFPTIPHRPLILFLLQAASSLWGGGSGGSGGTPAVVQVSPDALNQLEMRYNGLYSKPARWALKEW